MRSVAPDHHRWVVVPTNCITPLPATAWISPRPPSKNGASAWYLFVSIVLAAKSSEKTTVEIWPKACGRKANKHSVAAATSRFLHTTQERNNTVECGVLRRKVRPKVFREGKRFFLISSDVWVSAPPHPDGYSAKDILDVTGIGTADN